MKASVFGLALGLMVVQGVPGGRGQGLGVEHVSATFVPRKVVTVKSSSSGDEKMRDRQLNVLMQMVSAVNAGNAKGYAASYTEDAIITIYGAGELKGRPAIEQYELNLLREFPGARLAFFSIWQKDTTAVVHYAVNAKSPGGKPMGHEGLLFYEFQTSGHIKTEHRYNDSLTPMAQMGMLGAFPARTLPVLPAEPRVYFARRSAEEEMNRALVKASFGALDSRNKAAFLATIADDAVLDELIHVDPFAGKQGMKIWFEAWTNAVPDLRWTITNILTVGEFVLVETLMRGRLKSPLDRLLALNKPFAIHRAAIIRVTDGKIKNVIGFMNGKELAEATGHWPVAPD